MNYTTSTAAEQKAMLEQRQRQYESEHFAHAINKDLLVASGATDDATKAAIKVAVEAMATLDKAPRRGREEARSYPQVAAHSAG